MRGHNTYSGLALLVVVGVLGLLAVLATAFVTMAQLERRASQQRLHASKAQLLARSGLEDALARLGCGQDPDATGSRYGGEDWDLSGGAPSAMEADNEVYRPGIADREGCPVAQAMRPSFFERLSSGNPTTPPVDGRLRGISGRLLAGGYALRVLPQAGLFLNGGDPATVSNPTLTTDDNTNLRRILGVLAKAVDEEQGGVDGLPVGQADGWNLVDARPLTARGWESWAQVKALALGGSQAKLEALKPYLTLKAWVDKKVIAPTPEAVLKTLCGGIDFAGTTFYFDAKYRSWTDIKLGTYVFPEGMLPAPVSRPAPAFELLGGRNVGRSPVSLDWARKRRPVLIALLAGLKGLYLDETSARMISGGDRIGSLRVAEIVNAWSPTDDCHRVADQLLVHHGPLDTWEQWNAFCDTLQVTSANVWAGLILPALTPTQSSDLLQAKRDLLKANFNPNSDLNKFNPNAAHWRKADKWDLMAYSTEFSLLPTHGQTLSCTGRILGRDGRHLASRTLQAELAAPQLLRLTTQTEFVCGSLGNPDLAGDETLSRLPGAGGYLNLSRGTGRTWGHALPGGGGLGFGLQTYPEPCVDPGGGLQLQPSIYDGSLQLATVETQSDYCYAVAAPVQDMKLLARYTSHMNLDVYDSAAPGGNLNLPDTRQVTTAELGNGLLHTTKPVTLYPDGCYSELDRTPLYPDRDNAHGTQGVLSFWYKPSYAPLPVNANPYHPRGHVLVQRTRVLAPGMPAVNNPNQWFILCDGDGEGDPDMRPALRCFFEISTVGADTAMEDYLEHCFSTPHRQLTPHRWHLISFYWDFRSAIRNNCGELLVDRGQDPIDQGASNVYTIETSGNAPSAASDITLPNASGPHVMALGYRGTPTIPNCDDRVGGGTDATFDEFALYDLGGSGPNGVPSPAMETLLSPGVLALNRYQEGRYYRGAAYNPPGSAPIDDEAASWISPPLSLPPDSRLSSVFWTLQRPAELPQDFAEVELLEPGVEAHLWGAAASRSSLAPAGSADRQRWDVGRLLPGAFRARVVFRRQTPLAPDTPILDSPVLDDLTLIYTPAGGPRLAAWGPGE
jgi:hypothetical protein